MIRITTLVVIVFLATVTCAYAVTPNDFSISSNNWTYIEHNISKSGDQQAAGQPTNYFYDTQGNDVMQQNWWWFNAGGTGETALTQLTDLTTSTNTATLVFNETASNGAPLQFTLNYILTGIDENTATLEIDWSATNTSTTSSTPLNVFSYTNTKLLPNPNMQNAATQGSFSSTLDSILVTSDLNPKTITLTATAPSTLVGWELDDYKVLIDSLTDSANTTFPTTSQSLTNKNVEVGFEWAIASLGPGETTGGILYKNVNPATTPVIPEANTLLLAIPGLASIAALRRRNKVS